MIDYDPHRWWKHFFDIRGTMLRAIVLRVSSCVFWAAAVVVFDAEVHDVGTHATAHTLVGVALGLLLVFRTNASYDRFWEARKLWGSIINDTRNLGRIASAALASAPDLRRQVILWTIAFPVAAMNGLKGMCGIGKIASQLPADEVAHVEASGHCALAVARKITSLLLEARNRGVLSDYLFATIDNNVQLLVQYIGACERIHRTPLPFAYVVHLRRAMVFYAYTLPFGLVDDFKWWTVLAVLLIAYVFFGIEEIGVEIESPFGNDDNDLPLARFCETIEKNLTEILDDAPATNADSLIHSVAGSSLGRQ